MLCGAQELVACRKANPVPESWGTDFVWINAAPILPKTLMHSLRHWLALKIHRFSLWLEPATPVEWRRL